MNSFSKEDEELVTAALSNNHAEWQLSPEQKSCLRSCWVDLQSNIESVGVVTFLKLFETHPETLKPFIPDVNSVRELELNEWYRENLKVHAIRVMAVIEKTMHRLDDEKRAALILITYGRRHSGYGVREHMLDLMAQSFLIAIQPSLEERWTKSVEESWLALFRFITYFMKLGYRHVMSEQAPTLTTNTATTTTRTQVHENEHVVASKNGGHSASNRESKKTRT